MHTFEAHSSNETPSNPEQKETSANRVSRFLGKTALMTAEIGVAAGAMYASQELLFHESLSTGVNVGVAATAVVLMNLGQSSKEK